MTCEEFSTAGLELGSAESNGVLQNAAREHLRECPHCAVLHENWIILRDDLRGLAAETANAETPPRVEMRLLLEFQTKHKTVKAQRSGVILGWSLAAAAALVFAVTGTNWYLHRVPSVAGIPSNSGDAAANKVSQGAGSQAGEILVASNDSGDFALLPDSMPPAPEDATVVHVQMQRAALGALGLTVNEEHAGDWIQVDLLVGDDGLPQAVRLPQTASEASN
jgi:hypothetical protein